MQPRLGVDIFGGKGADALGEEDVVGKEECAQIELFYSFTQRAVLLDVGDHAA